MYDYKIFFATSIMFLEIVTLCRTIVLWLHCVTALFFWQCKHVNVNCKSRVFHRIVHFDDKYKSDEDVKAVIKCWVAHSPLQTLSIFADYLLRKAMKVQDWLKEFNKSNYIMDEMGIYILSCILSKGIGIILKNSIWTTKKNNDTTDVSVWFSYSGLGSFLPLKPLEPEEEKKLLKCTWCLPSEICAEEGI